MVKSDSLIGVKLKHVSTMGDKSPGTRTPLKETNTVPNDCYRICRIYVKINCLSKINVFGNNNKDFSQTLSSVLFCSVDPMPKITLVRSLMINIERRRKMKAAPKMITYLYKVVFFFSYKKTFIPYSEIYILLP